MAPVITPEPVELPPQNEEALLPADQLKAWLSEDRDRLDWTAKDILLALNLDLSVTYINKIKRQMKTG